VHYELKILRHRKYSYLRTYLLELIINILSSISTIYLAYICIFIGFIGLIWSADRFVAGAAAMAKSFGVTPMIIGLTIVSLGTSAPEVLVAINASLAQSGDLAIGNALGSNIANIALVLAITALIARIPIQKNILIDELPVLILVTLLSGFVLYDAKVSMFEGWLLAFMLIPTILYLIYRKKKEMSPEELASEDDIPDMTMKSAILWFFIGLGLLIGSSKILVWGGETTAQHFGVSPLIIGLTVIAVGTSLPELAASIMSALKGHHDIALGNIIGSNIFNILAVMAVPGIIYPTVMDESVFSRDYISMFTITVLLLILMAISLVKHRHSDKAGIGRAAGLVLLASYIGYYVLLFQSS